MTNPMRAVGVLLSLSLVGCARGELQPAEYRVVQEAPFVLSGVANLEEVAKLTGPDSINATERFGVAGTDLGSMFNVEDRTYFVFGDTFGIRPPAMTGGGGQDWRSNVMAVATDEDPSDGITFDRFIADDLDHANELIPSVKQEGVEITRIPTHGIAVGSSMYLFFMSVNNWGPPGVWEANYGGVARSTDGGETWEVLEDLQWDGDGNFIQVSPFKITNDGTIDIYFWGIPAGRFGGVKLMKVAESEIEDLTSYRYFSGTDAEGAPIWSAEVDDAALVVDDTVGELSVVWNAYLDRWIMTYLSGAGDVVIREGINPWGPWGDPITVATQTSHPGLYGPFMNPRYVENDGETIYFTLSRWDPYNVFWMKLQLLRE
jgi:hypothetical protein